MRKSFFDQAYTFQSNSEIKGFWKSYLFSVGYDLGQADTFLTDLLKVIVLREFLVTLL